MGKYEYKVLPTPRRVKRAKGVKGDPARFAHALTELMNVEAADGWEYFKSETLPMEAKPGIFKSLVESFQPVLIFRRPLEDENQGEIVSMTPAPVAQVEPQRIEPIVETPEPEPATPSKSRRGKAADDVIESEKASLRFDEDNIDPLKTLVDGHRGSNNLD